MENEVKEKKKQVSPKFLLIIFAILFVIIIGLLIAVFILTNNNDSNNNLPEEDIVEQEGHLDMADDGVEIIDIPDIPEEIEQFNDTAYNLDFEDGKELYKNKINEAESDSERMMYIVEYGRFLLYYNDVDEAINQLSAVDETLLNDRYKIDYYVTLRDYYEIIEDEDSYDFFNKKIVDVMTGGKYEHET